MPSIRQSVAAVQAKLPRVAALSGGSRTLATQEVKQALAQGLITKAERNLITRAISDSTNDVGALRKRLSRYAEAFEKADANGDGKISRTERKAAQSALDGWSALAGSIFTPQAQKDEAFRTVITSTTTAASGKKIQVAEFAIGSLLDKLNALSR